MATTLTGLRVQDTYNAIIKIGDNSTLTGTGKLLSDGFGNSSNLYLSTTSLGIGVAPTENLHIAGSMRLTGSFKDKNNQSGTTGQVLTSTATGTDWKTISDIDGVTSATGGTANYVPIFTSARNIENSIIQASATLVTISGNLDVNGTVTYIDTIDLSVKDPLIKLANANVSNTLDIGFYGKYVVSATTKYLGLYSDASDSNKFRLFTGLETEPTTVVDSSDTTFAVGTLIANIEGGTISGTTGSFSGLVTGIAPTVDLNFATKKYVDDSIPVISTPALSAVLGVGNTSGANNIIMADSQKVFLGSDSDLEIYHDGTDGYIDNINGELIIQNNSNDKKIIFKSDNGIGDITEYFRIDGNINRNVITVTTQLNDNVPMIFGSGAGSPSIKYDSTATQLFISGESKFLNDLYVVGTVTATGLNVNASTYHKVIATFPSTYVTNLQIGQQFNINNDALSDTVTFEHTGSASVSDFIFKIGGNEKLKIEGDGDVILSDGSLTVNEGNNLVKLSQGANSIGEIELKDGASVYLQGWGNSFRVAVNDDYTNRAFEISADKSATFTGSLTGTSASFSSNLIATGNITTDGIFINNSAPDDEVVQFIQSGRKTSLKTHFSSGATGSYLDFRISNGNVDGSFSNIVRMYPDQVNLNGKAVITTLMTNAIEKATTGQPITINSGLDASLALRVYYDMQLYNTLSFTDASWTTKGRISANSSGILAISGGSGTSSIYINSTDQVSIRNNADLGTYTRLGIAMDVAGNAANLDETTDYNAMSIAPYRVGSSYGMYFGGGHGGDSSAGFIQSAKVDGTDSSTISLNPFGGAVGINTGTSDPSSTLHIQGTFRTHATTTYPIGILNYTTSTAVSITKFGNISTASNLEIYYDITGTEEARITRNYSVAPLKFMRGNTTDMMIDGAGNVGIGKTTSLTSHRLSVLKGASNQQLGLYYDETNFAAIGARSNGDVQIYGYNGTSLTNILLGVDGSALGGNVGIGIVDPSAAKLVVNSSSNPQILVKKQTTGGGAEILFEHNSGATQNASIKFDQSGDNQLYITTNYDSPNDLNRIYLQPGGESAMTLTGGNNATGGAGRVGINTDTPDTDLQVTSAGTNSEDGIIKIGGSVASLGLVLEYDQVGATFSYITANPTYTSDTSIMKIRVDGDRNVNQLVLLGNGNIGIGRNDPNGNLEVITSSTVSGVSDTVNNVLIGLQSANRPTIILDTADTTYTNRTWNITNVGSAGSLYIGRNGLDAMIMKNNGYIGVGADPSVKFHIQDGAGGGNPTDARTKLYINSSGEAYISVNVPTNSWGGMRLAAGGTNKAFFELYDNTTDGQKLSLGTVDARDVVINTTNTDRVRIKGNGSVGINCDAGNIQLKVLQTRSSEWAAGFVNTGSVGYGLYIDTGSSANTVYNFACYTNTGDGMALNGDGRLHIGNKTTFPAKLTITSDSGGLKAVEASKPYTASQNIASFTNGNAFVRNSYDTFTIAQTDVACLVITETPNASNQGAEQRLTLTVGDNKCVIGTTSTVTDGMYFNVARTTSTPGYVSTNGITALRLRNDGEAIFANNIQVPNSIYVADYIYHLGDTNTYIRFTEDQFTWRTGGDDRMKLNIHALNVGPTQYLSSTVNDGPLRVVNNSNGSSTMNRGSNAIQLGPKSARNAIANYYYGGITWNGLLNYNSANSYDAAPHVWVGAKYKDFPGSERSSFVVGVKSGTGATGSGSNIPQERLELDFSGNLSITGTFTAAADVIAYSDKRLKENIKPIKNALEKVTQLQGITYNRKDIDDKSTKIGFIAQDIQKIIPEVVQDNDEYLGVSYGNITAVLVEAIKEQQKQIVSLQNEINKLKNK